MNYFQPLLYHLNMSNKYVKDRLPKKESYEKLLDSLNVDHILCIANNIG